MSLFVGSVEGPGLQSSDDIVVDPDAQIKFRNSVLAYTVAYIAVLMPVIVMLLRFSQTKHRDPDEEQDISSEEDTI